MTSARGPGALVLVGVLLAALAITGGPTLAAVSGTPTVTSKPHGHHAKPDPRRTRGLFVDPYMKAAQAGRAFEPIGSKAQPLWITDYYKQPGAARRAVKSYIGRAAQAHKTPLLTVYNIPDRDCGMYSSQDDQITDRYYRRWVTQVAAGMKGARAIVILEPDAISFIGNPMCTGRGNRLGLIKFAALKLTKAGAWVYLDAGHSGWQTPQHMAPLLKEAGVGAARGIATNVANSRTNRAETSYARQTIRQLAKRKVRGVHYVTDTSRNGAGRKGPANGDVCNPTAARLGAAPKLRFQGAFDGTLWVKLPGESDGPCNGGPGSGEFFPTGACRLMAGSTAFYDAGSRRCPEVGPRWRRRAASGVSRPALSAFLGRRKLGPGYQPREPGGPLNGPTTLLVIQPP